MTAARFASITSSLLARKGEAKPWTEPEKSALAWEAPRPAPQTNFAPPPQPSYAPAPQPSFVPPQQASFAPPPQASYTPPPQASFAPPPQPKFAPPPQASYAPPPQSNLAPPPPPQPKYAPPPPPTLVTPPPPPVVKHDALRKCAVRMTQQEYEQLGILAVKRDCTRHQLLRDAMIQLFNSMAAEYRAQCACLGQCGGTAWPSCSSLKP